MANIEKSSVLVQKEQTLAELRTKKKKTLTQLKRNGTSLGKIKQGIMEMQQQIAGSLPSFVMEIQRIKDRLTELFRAAKNAETIPAEEKEGLDEFIEAFDAENPFEDMFGMNVDEFEAKRADTGDNTDEFDRQKAYNFFSEYEVETKAEDKKEIRKAFIRLANRFHPDKAKSKKEKMQFHELMQQINSAYERNDLGTLVSLEEKFGDQKTLAELDVTSESAIIDLLDLAIEKANKELAVLENQLKRLKAEIQSIKKSDLGQAYKENQDAKKYGMETAEDMMAALREQKQQLLDAEEGMKTYIKTGEMPDLIKELFFEPSTEYYFDDDDDDIGIEELLASFEQMMQESFQKTPPVKKKTKKKRKKKR